MAEYSYSHVSIGVPTSMETGTILEPLEWAIIDGKQVQITRSMFDAEMAKLAAEMQAKYAAAAIPFVGFEITPSGGVIAPQVPDLPPIYVAETPKTNPIDIILGIPGDVLTNIADIPKKVDVIIDKTKEDGGIVPKAIGDLFGGIGSQMLLLAGGAILALYFMGKK